MASLAFVINGKVLIVIKLRENIRITFSVERRGSKIFLVAQ